MYYDDEYGAFISTAQLRSEFDDLKAEEPNEYSYSFEEYLENCLSKNGFLSRIQGGGSSRNGELFLRLHKMVTCVLMMINH